MKYLKFKDLFTALNLFLSFYAVILAFGGQFELGSYIVLFNVLILDIVDGVVARVTKTGNEFGKHFDSVTDFVGSSLTVSFFIYVALYKINFYLALFCGFLFLFVGVMREVIARIENISCKGYFVGMPRNAACVLLLTVFNSTLFAHSPLFLLPYLVLVSFFQLSHVPFLGNDKPMLMKMPRIRNYLMAGLVFVGIHTLFGLFWNSILIMMCCFMLSSYVYVPGKVWDNINEQLASK